MQRVPSKHGRSPLGKEVGWGGTAAPEGGLSGSALHSAHYSEHRDEKAFTEWSFYNIFKCWEGSQVQEKEEEKSKQ